MSKFRKKPVVIEAVRFDGDEEALREIDPDGVIKCQTDSKGPYAMIHTLEGVMVGAVGDWIIKGVKGELYPCKPDIFDATYEPVDEAVRP